MPNATGDQTQITPAERTPLAAITDVLVAVVVFMIPLLSAYILHGRGSLVWALGIAPILTLSIVIAPRVPRLLMDDRRSPAMWALLAIPGLMAIAVLFHPSVDGVLAVLYATAASAVGFAVSDMSRSQTRRFVAAPLLITITIQAVLAAVQLWTGSGVVPGFAGSDVIVRVIDGVARPQGTMDHVYGLAALGLLGLGTWIAIRRERDPSNPFMLLAIGASSALLALTFSRAGFIGIITIVVALAFMAIRGDRGAALLAGVIAAAYLITMLATFSSWAARAEHSLAEDLDDASLGRLTLTRQAGMLIREEPLVGVGPRQYVPTLKARGWIDERYPFVAHTYPLTFAAENGLPAGLVVAGLLLWLGVAAIRAGPGAGIMWASLLPLLLFDVLHYMYPAGQVMLGLWLGVLAAVLRWSAVEDADHTPSSRRTRSS
ncbi:MAG: O-antigen ligase family protein [Actinomycetota bacterium]|nr:O-antigen ligase family protein [Actinomycetota bacterium]